MTPKLKVLLSVVFSSLVLDQGTKAWVVANLPEDGAKVVVIKNWLEFVHAPALPVQTPLASSHG